MAMVTSNHKKGTVFVGLSGGVDSSVAALRLKEQGYSVVGVFIKVWHPDFLTCSWEQERLDAMRVAAKLEIPFLTCDAEAAYRDAVAAYFIESYKAGLTPNPDVMCNKEVKFGAFLKFALEAGADYIATGHYARVTTKEGRHHLWRGVDQNKDQSYFLWTLREEQLARLLLPIGDTKKEDIRAEAAAAGLTTARKKDSQGICFLGQIDIPDFLSHYIDLTEGAVVNEAGEAIGRHQGALVYTIGQRHGFTVNDHSSSREPYYVQRKDLSANTLIVSRQKPIAAVGNELRIRELNLISEIKASDNIQAVTRYRQAPFSVAFNQTSEDSAVLTSKDAADASAAGQSCVLYRGEECVGGGIIG